MFAKVFKSIFASSIAHNYKTRHVFMDLLTLADSEGYVHMTLQSIAGATGVPLEIVKEAIAELESPDPESQTHTAEGRRLIRVDDKRSWGWQIVNYVHYRNIRNEEARKDYFRTYQKKRRDKILGIETPSPEEKSVHKCTHVLTEGDASASVSSSLEKEKGVQRKKEKPYTPEFEKFWKAYPRGDGKIEAWRAWLKAQGNEEFPALDDLIAIVESRSRTEDWQKENGKFIPHASTWLNQRRWEDEKRSLKFSQALDSVPSHTPSSDEELDFTASIARRRRRQEALERWESTPHGPDEIFTYSE